MIKPSHQSPEHKYVLMGRNGEGSVQPQTLPRIFHRVGEFILIAFFSLFILSRQPSIFFAYEPRSEGMDEPTGFASMVLWFSVY